MNTPNDNTENTETGAGTDAGHQPGKGKRHHRTKRAAFWLRTIELRKDAMTREYRKSLRDVAREGISDEEYDAMLATLEKMARNLGWDETQADERGFGRGRGFGPGFGTEFGPDRRFGRGHRHPAMMHGFGHRHPHRDESSPADAPQA